ncbi:Alpha/Beta hydrolase protein [Haematococcus lacustris]
MPTSSRKRRRRRNCNTACSSHRGTWAISYLHEVSLEQGLQGKLAVLPRALGTLGRELLGLVSVLPYGTATALLHSTEAAAGQLLLLQARRASARHGVFISRGVAYGPGARHVMDVYSGCVVACPTYSLYPEARVPQMVWEASSALTWVMDHAAVFGGDPDNVSLVGHSAGGHLASLGALQDWHQAPSPQPWSRGGGGGGKPGLRQQAAYLHGPATSLAPWPRPARYDIAKHYEFERSRGVHQLSMMARAMGGLTCFPALSPAAAGQLPPCFLMSGCGDHMVPWHEGAEMAHQLGRLGVPVRHLLYQFAGHSDFIMRWPLMRSAASPTIHAPHVRAAHSHRLLQERDDASAATEEASHVRCKQASLGSAPTLQGPAQ